MGPGRSEKYVEGRAEDFFRADETYLATEPMGPLRRNLFYRSHEARRATAQGEFRMANWKDRDLSYQRGTTTSNHRHRDSEMKTLRKHKKDGLPENICPGLKPYDCPHCSKTFRSEPGMKLHIRDNHEEDE